MKVRVYRDDESKEYEWDMFNNLIDKLCTDEDELSRVMEAMDIQQDLLEGKELNIRGHVWKAKKLG